MLPPLQLRDMLHNDRFGRQVTVLADGRRVAASAINTALFQLCHEFARNPRLKDSQWHYIKVIQDQGLRPTQRQGGAASGAFYDPCNNRPGSQSSKLWPHLACLPGSYAALVG